MPIGVSLWPRAGAANDVTDVIDLARTARQLGLRSLWFGQKYDLDSLVLAATVAQAVDEIGVGTSVVPINPRHPLLVAGQAQTVQAASSGRFRLGLGLGATALEFEAFGIREDKPVLHLREYLTALRELIENGTADIDGERIRTRPALPTTVHGGQGIPLLVAAMGPQALRATGELADGVIPFLAGPRTLGEHIVPRLERARPEQPVRPLQIVAGVIAVVTDRPDEVRADATDQLAFYEKIPSYRTVLDREGVERAVDLALIGDEKYVADGLRRYIDAGATELFVTQTDLGGPEDQLNTWRLLADLSS